MSSRPGVMNTQQAKAHARGRPGADRRHAPGPRCDRPHRPLHDAAQSRSATSAGRSGGELADLLGAKPARRTINEFDAKRLLDAYGVPVTREQRVANARRGSAPPRARSAIPVVLKVVSDEIPHKTELGLVAVGPRERRRSRARLSTPVSERLDRLDPRPSDAAFLVQEFVADGVEVFAGISRDPDFGLSLAFGMGGIAIEITRDFRAAHAAAARGRRRGDDRRDRAARRMLGAIRGRPGGRRREPGRLPLCARPTSPSTMPMMLDEIDLNPIKALPEGRGCVVVDALIVARSPARG